MLLNIWAPMKQKPEFQFPEYSRLGAISGLNSGTETPASGYPSLSVCTCIQYRNSFPLIIAQSSQSYGTFLLHYTVFSCSETVNTFRNYSVALSGIRKLGENFASFSGKYCIQQKQPFSHQLKTTRLPSFKKVRFFLLYYSIIIFLAATYF